MLQEKNGLNPRYFADLVRMAQLVFDPSGGLSGRVVEVEWQSFGVPPGVVENLHWLGRRYQYSSPHIAPEIVWSQLTPETRAWFMQHKSELWQFEELLPARDED
jgi:hypothetical protein